MIKKEWMWMNQLNKNKMTKSDDLYTKYAEYILNESSTPIDDIEWLIRNLKQDQKEELEETIRTFIP